MVLLIFLIFFISIILFTTVYTRNMHIPLSLLPIMVIFVIASTVMNVSINTINESYQQNIGDGTTEESLSISKDSFCYGKTGTQIQMVCEDSRSCFSKSVDCDKAYENSVAINNLRDDGFEEINNLDNITRIMQFFVVLLFIIGFIALFAGLLSSIREI